MYKKIISAAAIFSVLFCFCVTSFAHPGRTDKNGGHYDRSTGEYHYHHGYPAHQHTNGVCPYDFEDKTGQSSGESVTRAVETKTENQNEPQKEKNDEIGIDDVFSYCATTNFPSFVALPIAVFMARFGKPKEWAWAWLGIGAFSSGAILYSDYNREINAGSFVFAASIEITILVVAILLILKMYKIRAQKGRDKETPMVSVSGTQQLKKKDTTISEQDYQRAMRIISMSVHSKEIKELAHAMEKTPQETINHFTEVVKKYNLERYS